MTKTISILSLLVGIVSAGDVVHAAVAPVSECRDRKSLDSITQVTSLNPNQIVWDCLDLSRLSKTDLLQLSSRAPSFHVRLSETNLSRADLIEIQQRTPKMILEVDSSKFNRVDVQELRKANVPAVVLTSAVGMNVNDYLEIAKVDGDPITIELNGPSFTNAELMQLVRQANLKFVIDVPRANLSEADIQNILKVAPETKFRF